MTEDLRALLVGVTAALPFIGLVVLWARRARARARAVGEALGAAALSAAVFLCAGLFVDIGAAPAAMFIPVIIAASICAVTENRMVNPGSHN